MERKALDAGIARRDDRRRLGLDPRADDDEGRTCDALELVQPDVDADSRTLQHARAILHTLRRARIGDVHAIAARAEQRRRGRAALAQADHGDLAGDAIRQWTGGHRILSVLSATNAQRIPMIQKRTTTCDSVHPSISK